MNEDVLLEELKEAIDKRSLDRAVVLIEQILLLRKGSGDTAE